MSNILSAEFLRHDDVVSNLREGLQILGTEWGIAARLHCECEDPACTMRSPSTIPVAVWLDAYAQFGIPEQSGDKVDALRSALLRFADHFDLLPGELATSREPDAPIGQLIQDLRDSWRVRTGVSLTPPTPSQLSELPRIETRNGDLTMEMAERVAALSFDQLEQIALAAVQLQHTAWGREAREAARVAGRWLQPLASYREVQYAREAALLLSRDAEWPQNIARAFQDAMEHLIAATMTFGFVHEDFTYALLEGIHPAASLVEARLAVSGAAEEAR